MGDVVRGASMVFPERLSPRVSRILPSCTCHHFVITHQIQVFSVLAQAPDLRCNIGPMCERSPTRMWLNPVPQAVGISTNPNAPPDTPDTPVHQHGTTSLPPDEEEQKNLDDRVRADDGLSYVTRSRAVTVQGWFIFWFTYSVVHLGLLKAAGDASRAFRKSRCRPASRGPTRGGEGPQESPETQQGPRIPTLLLRNNPRFPRGHQDTALKTPNGHPEILGRIRDVNEIIIPS
jgi:hypothetical protein